MPQLAGESEKSLKPGSPVSFNTVCRTVRRALRSVDPNFEGVIIAAVIGRKKELWHVSHFFRS
jgi:hypothetical protein